MSVLVFTILSLLFLRLAYVWYEFIEKRRKLKWLPQVSGWPILGILPHLKDTSDTIPLFHRFIKETGKLCAAEAVNRVMILSSDYDFLEFVLSSPTLITKSTEYTFLSNWLGSGLLLSTGAKWKQRRKLITPAFHFSILREVVKVFERNDEILIAKLKEKVDKGPFDISPYLALCALDIICESAMGISVEAQNNTDSDYVKTVKKMCNIGFDRGSSAIKSIDFLYPLTLSYYREQKMVKTLHDFTNSVIDSRMNKLQESRGQENQTDDFGQKSRSAFLDLLLRSTTPDGKPLSKEDIREEVDTFLFAGHDTTSTTLGFAVHLLAKHPEIQDRVFEEQAEIFADDLHRSSTNDDLPKMKYLEQVLKETLRFFPAVAILGRRTTEDIMYKGNVIPKDVNIYLFIKESLLNPENFPNPEVFNPDRYENTDGNKPYAYIPFSAGPRNCIGQKYAMLEMKCLLSKILRHFEVLPAKDSPPLVLCSEGVLKSRNGIHVRLTERKL